MNTTTATADIPTPTAGIIRAGSEVTLVERLPGLFIICDAAVRVRRTALMSAEQVANLTEGS